MDRETADFYSTRGDEWAAALPHEWHSALDGFLDRLPQAAHILELGCGDGRDAARMIARGFSVDVTDGVAEMAAMAATRTGHPARVLRFEDLAAVSDYDAVHANAALLHLPLADLPDVLTRIHRALQPGGLHYASFKGGSGELGGGARDDHGRFYSYLLRAELEIAYRAAGFTRFAIEEEIGSSWGGAVTPWLRIIAERLQDQVTMPPDGHTPAS